MIAASVAFAGAPGAAFADDLPARVTFSTFINAVKDHQIEKVQIMDQGKTAAFIKADGIKGIVNLIPDPDLLQTL